MVDVVLLADPNSKVWDFTKRIHEYIVLNYYGIKNDDKFPLVPLDIKNFGNKEICPHVPVNIRRKEVYFVHDSSLDPSMWWTKLTLVKDLLRSSAAERVNFVIPNLLWSRQDRKHKPRVPISTRAVARTISPGISRMISMDMHSSQVQGCYDEGIPIDNLHSFPVISDYLIKNYPDCLENLVGVSPDSGGYSRANALINKLIEKTGDKYGENNYSIAGISKLRTSSGEIEKDKLQLSGDVKGKTTLIIDDMISSGSTFIEAAQILRNNGAKKVIGYGTHGLFTNGYDEVVNALDMVITSNTMPITDPRIKVVEVNDLFAEAIYRDYTGESVSELF